MGQLTIDSVNATVAIGFADRDADDVAPPPNAAPPVVTSDNDAVLAVGTFVAGTDANGVGDFVAPLTIGTAGAANLTTDPYEDTSGNALTLADGTTAFPVPPVTAVTVDPGAPVESRLTVN